ncbi:MAG: HU family DNA-binding protein [Prevotellaceae bacterium]|jgi:predicted histone-like DNA-binding protein|nr:HU family DNA-binding protein [Prevotellaceae bacterium]
MSIYYRLDKHNDNIHPEGSRKRGLYPRIISHKTVGLAELCKRTAEGTTFNAFELEIAAKMLVDGILKELGNGNNVCIDDFGTFSVSAEAIREAQEQHDIRAESIRVKKIVFKTSQSLLKHLPFRFQRLPSSK